MTSQSVNSSTSTVSEVLPNLLMQEFESFDLSTMILKSQTLKGNPLGDPTTRRIPILTPRGSVPKEGWPVVMMLSGLFGNGSQSFNTKAFETNSPRILDRALANGEAPRAMYVYCDAMTVWGGSQFVDSVGSGKYASYILDEVCQALIANCSATTDSNFWCAMGGSSGGYGALRLASLRPDRFGFAVAIAPDSFFEASLLPDLRTALPLINKIGGIAKVRDEIENGKIQRRKEWAVILNALATAHCYAPFENGKPLWPIDLNTGLVIDEIWSQWLKHDPLHFLSEASEACRKVRFYLDVGDRDQFQLQYGTRQVATLLKTIGCEVHSVSFHGTHFEIGERRLPAWTWLSQQWRL